MTKKPYHKIFLLIVSFTLFWHSAFAAAVHEYRLSNGMKLIFQEDHRAPVIFSSIWYRVGGSYESDGFTGISHMLEHMMFKGTSQFGLGALNQLISDHGGRHNAITSEDYTVYYQEISSDQLALCFQLEADRMRHLLLDKTEFEKEKKVVMEERRMRVDDDPQGLTWERFRAAAYINSPYHHPTIGWMTDIQHYTVQDLRHWYEQWYAPNNALLVVVGDVNPEQALTLAQKYFGSIQSMPIPTLKPRREVPGFGKREAMVEAPAKLSWIVMGFQVPTLPNARLTERNDLYALKLASYILSGGNSARFAKSIVRGQRLAVSASANYDLYDLHQSLFVIAGIPAQNVTPQRLQAALWKQIDKLKHELISKKELDTIKAQLMASIVYRKDSLMDEGFDLALPEMVGLSWKDSDEFEKRMMAVTPEQVRDVANKYFIERHLTVAQLKPLQKGLQ